MYTVPTQIIKRSCKHFRLLSNSVKVSVPFDEHLPQKHFSQFDNSASRRLIRWTFQPVSISP